MRGGLPLSEGVLIALITTVGSLLSTLVGKRLEGRTTAQASSGSTTRPRRPWWMFTLLGGAITFLIVGSYAWLSRDAVLSPLRTAAFAYYSFEDVADVELWSPGEDTSSSITFDRGTPALIGDAALAITAPVSSPAEHTLHLVQTQPRRFQATTIVARIFWPNLDHVRVRYAVLCVRPEGASYICEALPQKAGSWQTFVFNLRRAGEDGTDESTTDLLGLALMAKFEATSPDSPPTVPLYIDGLEIWSD